VPDGANGYKLKDKSIHFLFIKIFGEEAF